MIRRRVALILLVAVFAGGRSDGAGSSRLAWSPDGEWIAYVVETRGEAVPPPLSLIDEPLPRPSPGETRRSRLWATRTRSGESILLDESASAISPPGWSPDGRSIAFGKVVDGGGRSRFEVIRIDGTARRVLVDRAMARGGDPADGSRSALVWSPDGRQLAVPQASPGGLAVISAESGRLVRAIENGRFPSWSPDGSKLFFIMPGTPDRLFCHDVDLGSARRIAAVGQVDGPPIVSRDGQSATLLSRVRLEAGGERVEVIRVSLGDGRTDVVTVVVPEPAPRREVDITSTSFAVDRNGENILATAAVKDQPCQVVWVRPRDRQVYKKFPVVDASISLSDLGLSPVGGVLAARLGEPGAVGLPVLCDLESMSITPLAPDDSSRDAWAALLVDTATGLILENSPRPIVGGRAVERTVALPIPGEIPAGSDLSVRIRRIGRLGRPLCEGPNSSPTWDNARFLFDYLREDFPSALKELEHIATREATPESNLRRLALPRQVFVGLGDYDRARGTLAYLKSIEAARSRRLVETTSRGMTFLEIPPRDFGWPSYARERIDILERQAKEDDGSSPTKPFDHRNPDAPVPGLGLDIEAPAVPALPEAEIPPRLPRRPIP